VVVTSTHRRLENLGIPVEVSGFSPAEARAFLRERAGLTDDAGADALAAELGCLPLALAQAAWVVRVQGLTYPTYLRRLRALPLSKHLARVPGVDYPHGAGEAIVLSLAEVERGGDRALTARLLNLLAVLSPDGIARGLLYAAAGDSAGADDGDMASARVDAVLGRLYEASLVTFTVDRAAVSVHRLIQRVIRDRARRDSELIPTLSAAAQMLDESLVPESRAWAERAAADQLVRQVHALWDAAFLDLSTGSAAQRRPLRRRRRRDPGRIDLAERLLGLRSWAVRHLVAVADLGQGIAQARSVLADYERVLGADHPDTLASRNNLAYAYESAGRLSEAIPLYEQALADCERVLGTDHPDTLASRNNLAGAYESAGRLGEAIPLYEQTLADCERVLDPEHPMTKTVRRNLGNAKSRAARE
jgi:tetratricopeptide (TPR) repeat protein